MKDKELREIVYKSFEEIEKAIEKLDKKIGDKDDYGFGSVIFWSKPWQELRKCKCEY